MLLILYEVTFFKANHLYLRSELSLHLKNNYIAIQISLINDLEILVNKKRPLNSVVL